MLILDKHKAIERMLAVAAASDSAIPEGPGHWFSPDASVAPARRLARFEPRRRNGVPRPAERRGWPGYPAPVEAPPFPVF